MAPALVYLSSDYSKMNAIDNVIANNTDDCGCCSATASNNWWQIDLGKKYLIEEIRVYGRGSACLFGHYGYGCLHEGHCALEYDTAIGACSSCVPGWEGDACNHECAPGEYGKGCTLHCGHCHDGNSTCNYSNGHCPHGCVAGYKGDLCKSPCDPGEYGPGCILCGQCGDGNTTCNTDNGYCPQGCASGFKGDLCNLPCAPGEFGLNCSSNCGYCHDGNTTCDASNGHCPTGCAAGYKGDFCKTKCFPGEYGPGCTSRCGQCSYGNATCNVYNGHCSSGCAPGYREDICSTPCDPGNYGLGCTSNCGQCRDGNTTCNIDNGHCPNGCASGFKGETCQTPCKDGAFGKDCIHYCALCINGDCNTLDGTCRSGCIRGYMGQFCNESLYDGNIAEHKNTSQYIDTNPTNRDVWNANNAVDGVNNCSVVNGDYYSLSSYSSYPWWQVDLGKVYNIQGIKVFGRKGREADIQLKGFQVHLSETKSALNNSDNVVTYDSSVYPSDGIFDIPVAERKARFCRLQIDASTGQSRPIVLCEVEVYGTGMIFK
ncbi:multiple epidermal growth factor-like domains protein 10 [Mya arenaria]|uniref:multiple epidermal growth factor-like domains protein 10 n=1 Tax=Mya arenaria TaxID=6604 RepID=UPI0022E5813E|nr:multiple epidermal growth factor-like domains protein 10 [Mya arenaria]